MRKYLILGLLAFACYGVAIMAFLLKKYEAAGISFLTGMGTAFIQNLLYPIDFFAETDSELSREEQIELQKMINEME